MDVTDLSGAALDPLLDAVLSIGEDLDLDRVLGRIVRASKEMVGARYAALGVLDADGEQLEAFLHEGVDEETAAAIGPLPRGHGVLGAVITEARPLRLERLSDHPRSVELPEGHPPMNEFLGVPVLVGDTVFGNLYLTEKPGGFDDQDERLLVALAAVAGAAIRNARDAEQLRVLAVEVDRQRIARDLHDTVIQRLFGAGLQLDALGRSLPAEDEGGRELLEGVLQQLDGAIADLRATIQSLRSGPDSDLESRLRGVVDALRPIAPGLQPLLLSGDLRSLSPAVAADLAPVLREAITNAARHARASTITPAVTVADGLVTLTVRDDGVGPAGRVDGPGVTSGLGLGNLGARAEAHDGGCDLLDNGADDGSLLRWWAPTD